MDTIGLMLSKPKEVQEQDPDFQDAQNSWKMKAVKKKMHENKAFAQGLIKHLDGKVGAETTDQILEGFMKYSRQEATPEAPQEQKPAEKNDGSNITQEDFE